jgi:hypothetical protein
VEEHKEFSHSLALELTAKSVRSCLAPAFGSSSPLALGITKVVRKDRWTVKDLRWDVFICHASEDKDEVARPLANLLAGHRLHVWIDEGEVRPGDSLRTKIDEGLSASRFGLVIFSPHFLAKPWTKAELGGLFARELLGSKVLIPVWHGVDANDVVS